MKGDNVTKGIKREERCIFLCVPCADVFLYVFFLVCCKLIITVLC